MKILFLTFYFEPDLCAGSFRNTPLAKQLSKELSSEGSVHVISTLPNRYLTYQVNAKEKEIYSSSLKVNRISVPTHSSNFLGQIKSFVIFFFFTLKLVKNEQYDIVFASSSRLFTAFLGAYIARKRNIPLYLDIRDIFKDSIIDILKSKYIIYVLEPILSLLERYTFGYASHINLVSKGFKEYFRRYKKASFSFYTNGIDKEFLNIEPSPKNPNFPKTILYAGNLGEGQGLHNIIPISAKALEEKYNFIIIGDGGLKYKLLDEINKFQNRNVKIIDPVNREELKKYYSKADYLFLHLNNYAAFEKVLPSKLFEYGAYDKPIIAGVGGYAATFIQEHLDNYILFSPGDSENLISQLMEFKHVTHSRINFIRNFSRENIVRQMVDSILSFNR